MMRSRSELLSLPRAATHYELLGITPRAAGYSKNLTAARRAVALAIHPDRDPSPEAADLMARANAAYEVLESAASTKLYLAQLRTTHVVCTECEGRGDKKKQLGFKNVAYLHCSGCLGAGYLRKSAT
jgi:DnaJ-class molecular chaperone